MTDRPRGRRAPPAENERTALGLVAALNEAGVTFVKLGQLLSTRSDLLPGPYVQALSQLQTRARPEPWSSIRAVIERELSAPIGTVFAWVEEKPLAAASVAQVHRAQLTDGTDVVVKVQRQTARAQVEADSDILLRLAQGGPLIAPNVRFYAFVGYALGFVGFVLALRAIIRLFFGRARW